MRSLRGPICRSRRQWVLLPAAEGPEALMELAGKIEADMIVVGRRGRGGFAELVLGSFSHYPVHHAHVPVVVVPGPG